MRQFLMLLSWHSHFQISPGVHLTNVNWTQDSSSGVVDPDECHIVSQETSFFVIFYNFIIPKIRI